MFDHVSGQLEGFCEYAAGGDGAADRGRDAEGERGEDFKLEEIVEAHRTMEENRAGGKIVLLM